MVSESFQGTGVLTIHQKGGSLRFTVHVQPRASSTEIAGLHGDALKIRLAAPPVDGAANDALVEFLADALGVPRRNVSVVTGHSSRGKVVEVEGTTVAAVMALADAP